MKYSIIAIIYNPKSTGPSQSMAEDFKRKLAERMPRQEIELIATTHAGHAEELAYKIATSHKRPLIVSSSGDGGYHEVINGSLKAQREGAEPTTGLLPAGNANDHYKNLHDTDIVELIAKDQAQNIDVLKLEATSKGKKLVRYAHSYIGFGVTPAVGQELNKHTLNFFNQVWIVLRALFAVKPVHLRIGKTSHAYDSIIMSNVDKMSKVLRISQPSRITDGKFEVTIFRRRNKMKLIMSLLRASLGALKENMSVATLAVKTVHPTLVQADGEIMNLDADTSATISIEKEALRCIV